MSNGLFCLKALGVSVTALLECHADLRMTLRYAHLSPAHLRGAVERLEGLGQGTPASTSEPAAESQPVGT